MIFQGNLVAPEGRFVIVVSRFNEFITSKLLGAAIDGLERHGVASSDIDVAWVPGAFELPLVAQKLATSKKYQAIITLGAVIRGSTTHYDYVCNEVAKGVSKVQLDTGVPVIFGLVTTENIEQAIERAGSKVGNKGAEAMITIIEMLDLYSEMGK